jgi:putative ABC transport system permease protein
MPARRTAGLSSRLRARDLADEALAGLLQRPGRSALTMLGLSQTADGQIGTAFSRLDATEVTVTDAGAAAAPAKAPILDFPAGADTRVDRINGVVAAGVWWTVPVNHGSVSARPPGARSGGLRLTVTAATPGALAASGASLRSGVLFNRFHQDHAQNVAVVAAPAAAQLGLTSLAGQPAIFIGGQPFTVIGILAADERLPQLNLGVIVPAGTALRTWGRPKPDDPAHMIIHTRLGAAPVVASQVPVALLPSNPLAFTASAPTSGSSLQQAVTSSLNTLLLALAGIALIVGMVGIANTTLVAVLERKSEIGLRRAIGARPVHISAQFLAESTALGLFGGLIGASLGVVTILVVTVLHHWTAVLAPGLVLAAPAAGAIIGLLAGLYPALRASAVEPAEALR